MSLYHCLIHIISNPDSWSDHLTFSKKILESNCMILQPYFPGESAALDYIQPPGKSPEGMLYVKYTPTVAVSSSMDSSAGAPVMFRIWKKKYVFHPHEELAIPVPPDQTMISIESDTKSFKYPLSQLLAQRPTDLSTKSLPLQIHYLYRAEAIDLSVAFPEVTIDSYRELLQRTGLVINKPSKDLRWIVAEFERRFDIKPIVRVKTFLQLALEHQAPFNLYTLRQLGILLFNTQDKTAIATESQSMLDMLVTQLGHFDFVYPETRMGSWQGCIDATVFLIQLLAPDSKNVIIDVVNRHIELKYSLFKMSRTQQIMHSAGSDMAMLAHTAEEIMNALLTFSDYYQQEFAPYFDLLSVLATQYYRKLCVDILELCGREDENKLVLTVELIDLYNSLSRLHHFLALKQLIDLSELMLLKHLFAPPIVDYIKMVKFKLEQNIQTMVEGDLLRPLSNVHPLYKDCHYSNSIVDVFAFIGYYSKYIFYFKFSSSGHKLYLLSVIEGALVNYLQALRLKGLELLRGNDAGGGSSSSSSHNDGFFDDVTLMEKMVVLLNNMLILSSRFQAVITDFKLNDKALDYSPTYLDLETSKNVGLLIADIVETMPLDSTILHSPDRDDELLEFLDERLAKIINSDLPESAAMQIFEAILSRVIFWFEDYAFSGNLSQQEIKQFVSVTLPKITRLFHEEGRGLPVETIIRHCRHLKELERLLHFSWKMPDLKNQSVLVFCLLAAQSYPRLAKSLRRLNYPKDDMVSELSECSYSGRLRKLPGYLFETTSSVDFISKNRKRIIPLGHDKPPLVNGSVSVGNKGKKIVIIHSLFARPGIISERMEEAAPLQKQTVDYNPM